MKIAILLPGKLPVPARLGGAIETLTTHIINVNEKSSEKIEFIVFNNIKNHIGYEYDNTEIISINSDCVAAKFHLLVYKIIRLLSLKRALPPTYYERKCAILIKQKNIDTILIEGNPLQTIYLKKKTKKTTILHLHTDILNVLSYKNKDVLKYSDKILVVSEYLKSRINEILNTQDVEILKNCVDLSAFDATQYMEFRGKFRAEYNIKPSERLLIYCGRLSEEKGVKELLLAFDKIAKYDCKLLIVGSSWFSSSKKTSYIEILDTLSKKHKDKIIFTGYIPNDSIPKYYAASDISVVPSIGNEAAGLVILEALASGLPVVASNIGGISEYADEKACLIVDKGESFVQNLEDALKKLILDKELYYRKKNYARNCAETYDIVNYYDKIINIFKK